MTYLILAEGCKFVPIPEIFRRLITEYHMEAVEDTEGNLIVSIIKEPLHIEVRTNEADRLLSDDDFRERILVPSISCLEGAYDARGSL